LDHAVHRGELTANVSAAASLTRPFGLLSEARFPIRQMRVVDDFGGGDERSMLADNTSAFNCRLVPASGRSTPTGLTVDVNPFENPEIQDGKADPPAAAAWADRSRSSPAVIGRGMPPGVPSAPSAGRGRGLALAKGLHAFSANGL
jgi:hypothetical protein